MVDRPQWHHAVRVHGPGGVWLDTPLMLCASVQHAVRVHDPGAD